VNEQLKRLGLTQLARVLPTLLDEARQQQLSYEAFLRHALDAELSRRQQRALERGLGAAHLPRRVDDIGGKSMIYELDVEQVVATLPPKTP